MLKKNSFSDRIIINIFEGNIVKKKGEHISYNFLSKSNLILSQTRQKEIFPVTEEQPGQSEKVFDKVVIQSWILPIAGELDLFVEIKPNFSI